MRIRSFVIIGALIAAIATLAVPLRAQEGRSPTSGGGLPPGAGRDIVVATCSACHSLTAITHMREGRNAWRHQIYDMYGRGAQVQPAEIETMLDYLVANFGPGVPYPGQTPSAIVLAPGNGVELTTAKCSICHGVDRITATKRPAAQWSSLVKRMVYLGATLTPDQQTTVTNYLSTAYGANAN
jgi:mono/diheme cytochrome c family protein